MSHLIAPSILSCDFANIQSESEFLNNSEADWFHVDVMDGVFVPNMSIGVPIVAAFGKHAKKTVDVHLMIVEPDKYLEAYKNAGADVLTVHYEACPHLHRTLAYIKELGCKAGVALNPHTPVSLLEPIINHLDLVCLMSVNPGFGGQKFIENTYAKVEELAEMREIYSADFKIEIDGGVNGENAKKLVEAGADVLVAGSYVFGADNPAQTIKDLKAL